MQHRKKSKSDYTRGSVGEDGSSPSSSKPRRRRRRATHEGSATKGMDALMHRPKEVVDAGTTTSKSHPPVRPSTGAGARRLGRARGGLSSSIARLRRSLHGAHLGEERGVVDLGRLVRQVIDGDDNSASVTLDTVSCASDDDDESSCFDAGEGKGRASEDENDAGRPKVDADADADDDDGYETDQAIICNDCSSPAKKTRQRRRRKERADTKVDEVKQQRNVQQAVERILQEQTMALEAWDEVASEYSKRIEPFTSMFVPHLLDMTNLLSMSDVRSLDDEHLYLRGKTVLDVAAGTGAGAIYAAAKGASSVTATDFSENMLRQLQHRISSSRRASRAIRTRVANGLCLPLDWTSRYDVVFSNFGVIYFPKVAEGLREMVRCATPGGRVCLSGWGTKEETRAFGIFPAAMRRCGLDARWYEAQSAARKRMLADAGIVPASVGRRRRRKKYRGIGLTPNYFCPTTRISSSQYLLHSMMTAAGLGDVRVVPVTKHLRLDSAEIYWDRFVLASPNLKRFVEHCLSPEEVARMKCAVVDVLREEQCGDNKDGSAGNPQEEEAGVVLKALAYIAVGTKS